MKIAFGYLRFTPDTFWAMTMKEWLCAVNGYADKHQDPNYTPPATQAELEALMEQYPDGDRHAS